MGKYHNKKTVVNGITFDSKAEAARYKALLLEWRAGEIRDLKLQPQFTLVEGCKTPEGVKVKSTIYRADFSYIRDGKYIVEDVKGVRTDVYKLKKNMLLDRFGIEVQEIEA